MVKVKVTFSKKIELDISTYTTGPALFNAVVEKIVKKFLRGIKNSQI
jgi:hypothetical protein